MDENNSAKYSIIWWIWEIWWIVQQNSLQVQVNFEFTKWLKWKINCKTLYLGKFASYHNIWIQFNDFIISKWKINYFGLYCMHANFVLLWKTRLNFHLILENRWWWITVSFAIFIFKWSLCWRKLKTRLQKCLRKWNLLKKCVKMK